MKISVSYFQDSFMLLVTQCVSVNVFVYSQSKLAIIECHFRFLRNEDRQTLLFTYVDSLFIRIILFVDVLTFVRVIRAPLITMCMCLTCKHVYMRVNACVYVTLT